MQLGNRCPFAHVFEGLTIKSSSSLSEMAAVKGEDTCATVRSVYKTSNYMQGMACRLIAREDSEEHEGRSEQIQVRVVHQDDLWRCGCAGIRCGVGQS